MRGDTEPKLQYFLYDGLDTAIDLYIERAPRATRKGGSKNNKQIPNKSEQVNAR